jgi:acetyltransferase-like isoleucine patch superfamily enzyme
VRDVAQGRLDGLAERRERLRMVRHVRPGRFRSFGERSFVEPPLRVGDRSSIEIGSDVYVRRGAWFSVTGPPGPGGAAKLTIGDRTQLGADIVIACISRVEIGSDVLTADRVFIGDTYHEYRDPDRPVAAQGQAPPRPVRIGDGAFLGIGCAILQGVSIGANAYVGAGAVVTRDVPPRCLAVGNPARVVKHWDAVSREWAAGPPPAPAGVLDRALEAGG